MSDNSSASNFDNYIAELHEYLDRIRDIVDVDEQSSVIVADLAQAYSEHSSPIQTAMCLSALFCGQKNILTYLRRATSKSELKKTKVQILQFLKFFIENATVKILPYSIELKSVLLTIFNVDNASEVRASIFPILSQLMELTASYTDMQNEVDKMATTFLDQIGLQSSKTTATIKGLCLAFLGLLCKYFPEYMKKYADPLLIAQYLKYLHEQLVKDVKFEMLIAAGAIEGLVNYLVNFIPSSTPAHSLSTVQSKNKEVDKRLSEERIRCESDLKRIYIYGARAIQTQEQTNLNRYALVKVGLELFAQHSTLFTEYLYEDYVEVLRCIRAWNIHDNYEVKKVAQRAYDTFLLGVANALKEKNIKTPEERRRAVQVFQYFIKQFRDQIDTPQLEIRDLAMGIRGYGVFANACKLYGTEEDIKFMFVGLVQRCEQIAMPTVTLSQAMDIFDERFYGLPNLIDALSAIIIEMTNIGEEFLGPLERLTVMTIDYYPRYQPKPQATTCSSVIKMVLALQTKPNSYKPFISRIVTQALIRCCSHPLKTTVEQQLENYEPDVSDNKTKSLLSIGKTITYENYLPLWRSILSVTTSKEFDTSAYPIFDRQNMLVSLYDEIIESILHIIDRLDLNVEKEKTEDENNDETTTNTDPVFGMRPVKPMDFQIFYNLIDFCQDLLPDQSPELFQKWIFRFLYDIIATSTKYPLVSGIYRFATFVMNICLKLDYFKSTRDNIEMMEVDTNENEQVIAVCGLVRRFAHEVLSRQKQYRDDLLISCLQFIMSLPSECIDYDFSDYVPAIQLALSIGLNYLPLAEQTINSLERWSQSKSLNLANFYNQILPYLDDFLRLSYDQGDDVNVRAVVSTLQEKTRSSAKSKRVLPTRMLKKSKQIKHLFEDSDIRRVQFRILKYLGSLSNHINHYLIDDTSNYFIKEAIAWDNNNHITFNVPFDDIKPTIHLDVFLPRIVDLALHSSDRQTKITSCELLQSIMLYMIGKSANNRSSAAASYEKLYEHLFPAVLQLSCDSDTFTKTLFTTFMIQMIHWFTKNHNYENPETMSLLDTFMNGMISGQNASIRDFSGICLKEFLQWTVKHAGGYDKPGYLKNATSVLKRILSFSLHPNSFKRLGSTLAWNSIYTLYRESEILVDVYTIQLLYVFVESLAIAQGDDPSLGTQQQAIVALSHVERIIKEKSKLFIKETPKRHRPPLWAEASLDVTIRWLLRQCGRIETESRRKCIELVCTFIPLLPGIRSIREYFDLKVQSEGNLYFIDRFEGTSKDKKKNFKANLAKAACLTDMNEQFSLPIVYQWLDTVIASLDCYTWVFSQGFLNPLLFQDNNQQSRLIVSLSYFISKISMNTLHDIVTYFPSSNQSYVFTPSDVRQFDTAKCTVIVRLLNFITALWTKYPQDTKRAIDNSFYSTDLTKLILTCVFNPAQLGFDINNEEINRKLPERIRSLLKSMITHLPDQLLQPFSSIALQMTKSDGVYNLTNELNMNPVRWTLIFTITRGLHLLHDVRLLAKPKQCEEYAKELWTILLTKMITHEEDCDKANIISTIDNQRGLQALFDHIIYLGIQPNEVLPYFFQSNRIHTDSGMSTIGTYLLNLFKHQITSWLGTTPHFIINNIGEIKTIDQCRSIVSFLTIVLDLCSKEKDIRQQYGRQFVDGIYTCWPLFSLLYRSINLDDKLLIVTLLTKTFIIDSRLLILHEQFQHISQMYLSLLIDKQLNLTFKTRLLDLLPFFASLDTDEDLSEDKRKKWSDDFCRTLHTFTADCFPLKSTEFHKGTQEYHDYQGAIRKILSALELSSSFILFELLIWMLCCETHHIFEDEILLSISRYVIKLNDQIKQLNLLDYIYSILFGKNPLFRLEHRLNALEKFILKILTSVKKSTLIEFYNKYISLFVIDQLDIKLDLTLSSSITSVLINKIATYRFIDYMYTILNKDDVFGLNSSIAKTFYETVKKQEEARKILNVEMPITTIKIGSTMDGKELTKYVIARARAQFIDGKIIKSMEMILTNVTAIEKEMKMNLIRSLAISSFNCLISILICTQTEAKLYKAFIFDANISKDEYIWENLIDPDRKYTFPLELEHYYKKDKRTLLNILSKKILTLSNSNSDNQQQQRLSTPPRYLPSQYLFGSSLTDELAVFDFTSVAVSQQQNDLNNKIQSNSLPENSPEISLYKKDDDKPALIEGTSDDEIGTDLIEIEMDELNLHPCMIPMVCLLKHMETNGITSSNTQSDMPPWMICLYKKFNDPTIGFNIKLFIMRLITHTHTIFKPYARYWLTPIIQMCNQMFEKSSDGLNTFLIDTIVVLLSWSSIAIPSELDATLVQRLLEYLFLNCTHKNSFVMKTNLDLIKKLVESWKDRIYTPTLIIYKLISDQDIKSKQNAIGLSLIGILLANEILPYKQINDLPEDKFNESLLKNMKNSFRNIYAAAAEVVGMLLNVKKLKNESNQRLLEQLSFILKWHSGQGTQDTYVTCIYSLQKHYPEIIDKTVMNKLLFGMKKLYGDFKIECLEAMIPNITEFDSAYLELKAAGILDILIHKDFSIRGVALRLLHKLLPKLTHDQLFEIAQILSVDGPNECQYWTLEICKWMYDYITQYITNETKTSTTSNISEKFYHCVRELLLEFLSSKNEYIRVNCRNFWCDSKRLSISSHHRLIALVDQLYSIKSEHEYLNYSTNFLLERTSHNPDYNHFIFENPLDKCIFQEFPLTCNWRQRHHTYMTPLFTLQSQTINDPLNINLMTQDPVHFMQTITNNINLPTSMILQTQEISNRQQFIPTQILDNNNINYNWLKQTNTFDTTDTFALPTLSTQTKKTTSLIVDVVNKKTNIKSNNKDEDDIFRLKRRFLKDTGELHKYFFAKKQNEKKQNEKQFLNEIKLKQENQVEKYRTYRIGELPDIQIRYSDIIIPLQALAQYDNYTARLLYSNLFTSILTSLEDKLTNDEYIELIETIQHRFNVILSQSEIFYPSLIAAIFDIILSKGKQIKISAQYISAAAIASHLESMGISTLEYFIRLSQTNEQNELIHGSSKKKFKSDPNLDNQLYKQIDHWLELAKCYRSLVNYDDVRGIFYQIPVLKSLTLQAIEEESHSDFLSALNTYVTALEQYPIVEESSYNPILELEHEFWTQSMLNCCNQLNNWTIMSKHIFIANTTFDTLWSNAYQLNYLMPYAIRSKLKLLISGSEQEQLEQEDLCQFFNNLSATSNTSSSTTTATSNSETTFVKRSYIEKQYPFELATFFLYQKDFDRSKYYIQYAKEQFLLHWSQLSRLNEYGRKTTIQLIQPYHELDQFLVFLEHNLPVLKNLENRYLTNNKNDTITRDLFLERIHKDLISQWQLPDVIRSSIQTWDDVVTNRALFLDILDELIGGPRMSFTSRLKATEFDPILVDYKAQSSLDMAYCALRQRNFKLALTKLNDTRNRLDLCQNPLVKSIYWNEIYCDVHLKRHQIQSTLSSLLSTFVAKELKKLENKINSLEIIDEHTATLNSTYIQLNSQFCRTTINLLLTQPNSYLEYEHDENISQAKHRQLEMYLYGLDNQTNTIQKADLLINELFNKGVHILKNNIDKQETNLQNVQTNIRIAKENVLSRDYNELASLCDDYLRRYENNEDDDNLLENLFSNDNGKKIAEIIIHSVLSSMKYGSNEGVKRFSRLLQIVELYPNTMESIANRLQDIPCWMFFDCLYQITAHLDKPIALKLYPLIENIVKLYPQSIVYPFKLSYETFQYSITDPTLKRNLELIRRQLDRFTPRVNEFIQALNQLNPQQQFENWSKELYQLLTNDIQTRDLNKLKNHLKKFKEILFSDIIPDDDEHTIKTITSQDSVFNEGLDKRLLKSRLTSIRYQFKNTIEKDLDTLFGKHGELFSTVLLTDVKSILTNLGTKLKTITQDKSNINDYSTWFSLTFQQQQHRQLGRSSIFELEIPGQYTSRKKPLLEHHIKIVGFDEKILVLQSLRLPKRLTIRGHDENDYRFLVKGGEDIRQDQRIQALFTIMNDLYENDPNCHQSNSAHISIKTYKVIPMSSKLGMIEWLDNTRPLKELIEECYTTAENDIISQGQHPRKLYQDYVTNTYQKAKPTAKSTNNTIMYAELFVSLTKNQVQDEFNKIQSVIPSDLLRRAYYKMANSHEGFYTLRQQFITSYAVLCTSHYILGIGDRHQSNFLIDTLSGQVIGIDFGSAFNAATIHLPVPELIPIRLTRQLIQLMSPIGTAGLFRATMIHTMNVLRENSDLLLSTMNVFIKEPLMEWMEHALKTSKQITQSESNTIRSDDTYAKDRIRSARLKLNGINPAIITSCDLKLNNFLRPSSLKEALRHMEKVVGGDQTMNKRAQIMMQYGSNRFHKLTVDEQVDCVIDQATDVDILGRSWAGLETFM
ncbi:unnamed protein product [Adineta steineri]|uniref:Non-specific serine/threonine protein kinase n=1 Tax=Adineta steineri TaxID=433720 RepID=A0A815KET7_9BILA|nr:unnamed protein product [Adineta steineri]